MEAGDQVALAQGLFEVPGQVPDDPVTGFVVVFVVDPAQTVHVDEQDRRGKPEPGLVQELLQAHLEGGLAGEAGEVVGEARFQQPFLFHEHFLARAGQRPGQPAELLQPDGVVAPGTAAADIADQMPQVACVRRHRPLQAVAEPQRRQQQGRQDQDQGNSVYSELRERHRKGGLPPYRDAPRGMLHDGAGGSGAGAGQGGIARAGQRQGGLTLDFLAQFHIGPGLGVALQAPAQPPGAQAEQHITPHVAPFPNHCRQVQVVARFSQQVGLRPGPVRGPGRALQEIQAGVAQWRVGLVVWRRQGLRQQPEAQGLGEPGLQFLLEGGAARGWGGEQGGHLWILGQEAHEIVQLLHLPGKVLGGQAGKQPGLFPGLQRQPPLGE